ncbi:MAG: hypothetical protein RIM99_12865 [Cyclobacteriaceae bacterium]
MKRKKVLFYSTNSLGILHLGEELELLQNYTDENAEIHVIKCSGGLGSCYINSTHNIFGCAMCVSSRDTFHSKFNIQKSHIHEIKQFDHDIDIPLFKDLGQLLNFNYKGIPVGRAAASSAISLFKEYDINENHSRQQELIKELLKTSINVTENFFELLQKESFDELVLFNGRFAELSPAMEIAKQKGIPYYTYERGATESRYQLFKNALPHSIKRRTEYMNELWETSGSEKEEVAIKWFESQVNSAEGFSKKFTAHQVAGKLPTQFDENKTNIAIFTSSDHETKVIEEWKFGAYKHQNQAIIRMVENFKDNKDIHFYLRVHPHLRGVDSIQTREISNFKSDNLTVIDSHSEIGTYTLMKKADKVISFGSTIGIEATYLGLVSIMFGRSLYENIDATYCPKTFEELFSLITDKTLKPKSKQNTLRFAFYRARYGFKHVHYKFENKRLAFFKGERIKQVSVRAFISLLKQLKYFGHWNKMNKILVDESVTLRNMLKLKTHFKK